MSDAGPRNPQWESTQNTYFKLSRALRRSKFTESELLSKCREIKVMLVEKAQELQVAQALKLDDDVTISSLRHEMEKAVGRADLMTARELAAKQLISELQREVDNLRSRLAAEQARTSGAASTTAPLENSVTTFGAAAKTDSIPTPPARPLLTPNQYANSFEEWKKAKLIPHSK